VEEEHRFKMPKTESQSLSYSCSEEETRIIGSDVIEGKLPLLIILVERSFYVQTKLVKRNQYFENFFLNYI
jgi:hypothetical protein